MTDTNDPFGSNPYAPSGYHGLFGSEGGGSQRTQQHTWEQMHQDFVSQLNKAQQPGQYHGLGYTPSSFGGVPSGMSQAYGAAGQSLLKGSQGAEEELRKKYEAMLRARAGGLGMAYDQQMRSAGNQFAGAGISPELLGLVQGGYKANYLGQLGSSMGDLGSDLHGTLAELLKGTGTELAGLKQNEAASALNYLVGKASADAAQPSGISSIANLLGGIAGVGGLFK